MKIRTYGWVQNPSDFSKLKLVVQIFDRTTKHYHELRDDLVQRVIYSHDLKFRLQQKFDDGVESFPYDELVGSKQDANGNSCGRKDAVANGIIQITVKPQTYATTGKLYTDDWTAQGFLSWALALGFLQHSPEDDHVTITELGREFAQSDVEPEKDEILLQAISAYPPAGRVLNILENSKDDDGNYIPLNKFEIGSKLGFKGEPGFTSYPSSLAEQALRDALDSKEQQHYRQDFEGTSDKYARMIASWLRKFDLVMPVNSKGKNRDGSTISLYQNYRLTAKGVQQVRRINGNSSNRRIKKYVPWSMLGTRVENLDYVRTRRAVILNYLLHGTSFTNLISDLKNKGFNDKEAVIRADIQGLNGIGIRIDVSNDGRRLRRLDDFDRIDIPPLNVTENLVVSARSAQKARLMATTDLPLKYYELVDIAYDGHRNRDFETLTMELFEECYGFKTQLMGGGRKPDGIAYNDQFGIIIDTKAYKNGYPRSQAELDKMVRYIEENRTRNAAVNPTQWWNEFPSEIDSPVVYFLWVSSYFSGHFETQLTSAAARSETFGAALGVENLLIGADKVQKMRLTHDEIESELKNNSEIIWS